MDTAQYETELAEIKTEMERLLQASTLARAAFVESAKVFIADWSVQAVEEAVTSKPEVTKKIGVERLRALKAEIGQLKSKLPELVVEKFAPDKLWLSGSGVPKNREGGRLFDYEISRIIDDNLDRAVRELMGYAGSLLVTYEFVDLARSNAWEQVTSATPAYRYKHGYSLTQVMSEKQKEYKELVVLFMKEKEELDVLKARKAAAEAKGLWDSV